MGASTKVGFGATSTVDNALFIISENIVSAVPHINPNGFRGTYSENAGRTIQGVEKVEGPIVFEPSPEEAAKLLALLGFTNTTGTFTVNDSALPSKYWTIDREQKVHTFAGMQAAKLTMSASAGVPWSWTIDFMGTQESAPGNAGTFPAISITETPPLALHHATVTLLGSSRVIDSITVTIDNMVEHKPFNNAYHTPERHGRMITVEISLPYEGNEDLYDTAVAGDDAELEFTYGNYSSTWTFGNIQFPKSTVTKQKGSKRMLSLSGQARQSGTTKELVIVHDSTP